MLTEAPLAEPGRWSTSAVRWDSDEQWSKKAVNPHQVSVVTIFSAAVKKNFVDNGENIRREPMPKMDQGWPMCLSPKSLLSAINHG
jgi:hypothetical protein